MREDGVIAGIVLVLGSSFIARDYYWRLLACMGFFRISNPYPGYCGPSSPLFSILYNYVVIFTVLVSVGLALIFWSIHYPSKPQK